MRHTLRAGVATLALVCGAAFAVTSAIAQTSPQPNSNQGGTVQGSINPSNDQTQALIKSLQQLLPQQQPAAGWQPAPGAPVPQDMQLQPMPSDAASAVPQVKDHHVAKVNDGTILIVDPITRQIVGVITVDDDDSGQPSQPGAAGQGAPAPAPKQ
jgi:hypothetical protein